MTEFTYRDSMDRAFRQIIREKLQSIAPTVESHGLNQIFLSFDTQASGVGLSVKLRERYPEHMTIVLQHKYWDLVVRPTHFEVVLGFDGYAERLTIPFAALFGFRDEVGKITFPLLRPSAQTEPEPAPEAKNVLTLDKFRK